MYELFNMTRRAVELNLHKQRLIIFFMEKKWVAPSNLDGTKYIVHV